MKRVILSLVVLLTMLVSSASAGIDMSTDNSVTDNSTTINVTKVKNVTNVTKKVTNVTKKVTNVTEEKIVEPRNVYSVGADFKLLDMTKVVDTKGVLDSINAEYRYDLDDYSHSVFGVVKLDLTFWQK